MNTTIVALLCTIGLCESSRVKRYAVALSQKVQPKINADASMSPAELCQGLGSISNDAVVTPMMNKDRTSERGIFFLCALDGDWFNLEVCLFKKGFEQYQACKKAVFFDTYLAPILEDDGTFDVPIENGVRKTSIKGKLVDGCLENNEITYEDGTKETGATMIETVFFTKKECVAKVADEEDIPHTSDEDTKCCCKHGADGSAECSLLPVSELSTSRNPLRGLAYVCPKHKGYHSWDNNKHFAFGGVLPDSCQ